jgi:nucleotidyltransferase/DNA polymerase involved in DNA repair
MPDEAEAFVASLPVAKFHGVGPRTAAKMHALGIETGADLRGQTLAFLRNRFGKAGSWYRVHEAANGNEAIEVLQSKFAIDLVFTDINLPHGISGLDLAKWTLSNRPRVKVLATTGDSSIHDVPPITGALLAKPYTGRDLLDRIRQAKPSDEGSTSTAGDRSS